LRDNIIEYQYKDQTHVQNIDMSLHLVS